MTIHHGDAENTEKERVKKETFTLYARYRKKDGGLTAWLPAAQIKRSDLPRTTEIVHLRAVWEDDRRSGSGPNKGRRPAQRRTRRNVNNREVL